MRALPVLPCTTACHRRDAARKKRHPAQWIWSSGSTDLLSDDIEATYTQSKHLTLLPVPSLRQLRTATPAGEASVQPGDAKETTRGEESFLETGRGKNEPPSGLIPVGGDGRAQIFLSLFFVEMEGIAQPLHLKDAHSFLSYKRNTLIKLKPPS
jgi:hypothetical protein